MIFSALPWNHWIRDDIISPIDLLTLTDFCQLRAQENHWGLVQIETAPAAIADIMSRYQQCITDISAEIHARIPAPRHQTNLRATTHIAVQPAGYDYPPHYEHPAKVWSFITYIWPEQSQGTQLMKDESRRDQREVEWRPGRTLIFAGETDRTWHSYASGANPRATLCGFMIAGEDPTR